MTTTLATDRGAHTATPVLPTADARLTLRPLPTGDARITGGFWALRQERNGRDAVRSGYQQLETAGNFRNLRIAAGLEEGEAVGPIFMDSDVTKWLEAVAWEYGRAPAEDLLDLQREVTALYARAQADDGYLDSVQQVRGKGERYTDLKWSHEMYCAGHLYQAAVAQHRATGDTGLLDVAIKNADHLVRTFGDGTAPDGTPKRRDVDGHPVVEMGLVELYRETGNRDYLDLAHWFVDARGHGIIERAGGEPTYFSDRVPSRQATTVEGHAVRAVYLAAGAVDVAIETGDTELLAASETQFADMMATKAFITGGLGARWDWEAFGDPYELPTDRGYAETCAAIGGVQWAWRLLLATGKPVYADAIERLLYNAFLAGVSLAGTEYFYVNPLQQRDHAHQDENRSPAHGRRGWFDCACCPPNIMRTFASLDGYLATATDGGLQVHQYATADLGPVRVETDYPHEGRVRVTVTEDGPLALGLRIPAWSDTTTVTGPDGSANPTAGTLHVVDREWSAGDTVELVFDTTPHRYVADARIDAARGQVAIERGPLVYAVEQADQQGFTVDDLTVDADAPITEERRDDLLDGVVTLRIPGHAPTEHVQQAWPYQRLDGPGGATTARDATSVDDVAGPQGATTGLQAGRDVTAIAVPYYAWANRGAAPMRVWLPLAR
ncbi:glycoside hydrolase family 127 protein [Curtobacterium flaccumfaciens pv. flaccumfaciens]|uniref:glycoside hydrolase family 127 protein n=1 Tax=Curtobacterium flaccumfaciens TaxID=2035 RepID=UPI001ADCCE16|nr:beta-L-arabinofuranosidase domain-containing protein [Curtobacterium flaccumfaciens]MBO9048792.1 glycoside hydrolase family 127 protein [Curtobacterium flaccumfaciens pv. flaccumfaciens]MBO9058181.1 glycoside hydrolase family 127 protein [Curtobacterium flaccumfaciens pv. flaccumfaciens]QTR90027.1 glycoside hydrolase family 127 protein [Curtobacterium flaccumfaciens pv. flaccumfaciens]